MDKSKGLQRHVLLWLLLATGTAFSQETATITGSEFGPHKLLKGFNERVILTGIDHKMIGTNVLLALNVTKPLTPGRHTIQVRYTQGTRLSKGSLWLDAEPGKAYVVRAHAEEGHAFNERRVFYRIEEVATGNVVGGIDPGEPSKDDLPPEPVPTSAPAATNSTPPSP